MRLRLLLGAEFVLRLDVRRMQGYLRRHGHGATARDLEGLLRDALAAATNSLRRDGG